MTASTTNKTVPNIGVIAVIVPVYNVALYLKECLDSLLAQTYPHWVAYVIDDGSTDESAQIVDDYASKDTRFRVFHKKDGGLSSARNFGLDEIKLSRDIYVAIGFLDSDDWIAAETYAEVIAVFNEKKPDLLFHGYTHVYSDRKIVRKFTKKTGWISRSSFIGAVFSDDEWNGGNGSYGNIWTKYLSPKNLGNLRFIEDREYVEDELFNTCVAVKVEKIYFISEPYYYYRQRDNSLMTVNDFTAKLERGRIKALEIIENSNLNDKEIISYKVKFRIFKELLKLKENGFKSFLKDGILFSNIACRIFDVASDLYFNKKIKNSDYDFIKELSSYSEVNDIDKSFINNEGSYINILMTLNLMNSEISLIKGNLASERDKNKKLSAILLKNKKDLDNQKKINELLVLDIKKTKAKLEEEKKNNYKKELKLKSRNKYVSNFYIGKYIKYMILSRITFGNMRKKYKEKYNKQNNIYKTIRELS